MFGVGAGVTVILFILIPLFAHHVLNMMSGVEMGCGFLIGILSLLILTFLCSRGTVTNMG
jgi:hypothetical protein